MSATGPALSGVVKNSRPIQAQIDANPNCPHSSPTNPEPRIQQQAIIGSSRHRREDSSHRRGVGRARGELPRPQRRKRASARAIQTDQSANRPLEDRLTGERLTHPPWHPLLRRTGALRRCWVDVPDEATLISGVGADREGDCEWRDKFAGKCGVSQRCEDGCGVIRSHSVEEE